MRAALLQMDLALGDPVSNRAKAETLIRAEAGRSDLVLLPELWNTGYCLDRLGAEGALAETEDGTTLAMLDRLAKECGLYLVGSTPVNRGGRIFNLATVHSPAGDRLAEYAKVHLVPMMNEHQYLAPGDRFTLTSIDGAKAGLGICYDLRFPEFWRALALGGAELLLIPAQWPAVRAAHWRALCMARAIENQCFVLACNRVGQDADNAFDGHSLIIDPWGQVLAEGGAGEEVVRATLDLGQVSDARERVPALRDRRPDVYRL